ncbi:MAG: hypothetical protein WC749_15480 [Dehalococcoidia bacterium]
MSQYEKPAKITPSPCMRHCGREQPDIMCLVVKTCPIAASKAERIADEQEDKDQKG